MLVELLDWEGVYCVGYSLDRGTSLNGQLATPMGHFKTTVDFHES